MQMVDDRTKEEKGTHLWIVVGTDSFLSGWGKAKGGMSYAGWACEFCNLNAVLRWVQNRSDMIRVRVVGTNYRPRRCAHCHIYVVREGHPALNGSNP